MLSKTAEYALRVAVCLAQSPDTPAAADELARNELPFWMS
jgi:hypothetical protein